MTLGETVRKRRQRAGLKQIEMARRIGWHVSRYNRVEKDRRDTTLRELETIAEGLGCPVKALIPAKRSAA